MRFLLTLSLFGLLTSCYSKLDKKENESLMLDLTANEKLTISPEAFVVNAINYNFLEKECRKIVQGRDEFLYVKDGSSVLIKDKIVQEVHLKTAGDFLNYDLKIGKRRSDFEATFVRLENRESIPFINNEKNKIRLSCCIASESVWEFEFENNVLISVDYIK